MDLAIRVGKLHRLVRDISGSRDDCEVRNWRHEITHIMGQVGDVPKDVELMQTRLKAFTLELRRLRVKEDSPASEGMKLFKQGIPLTELWNHVSDVNRHEFGEVLNGFIEAESGTPKPVLWFKELKGREAKPTGECYDIRFCETQGFRPLFDGDVC